MFGFSFSELVVVIVVALVVIGPKDLPKMLRKLGQYAGKLRRMASELRAQSGIDDALRTEGLADDINEIRKLARGELDTIQRSVTADPGPKAEVAAAAAAYGYNDDFYVVRDREFPRDGADSYGALPDNAIVYAEGMPKTALARDPLYVLGDPNGVVPEEPKVEEDDDEPAPAAAAADDAGSGDAGDAPKDDVRKDGVEHEPAALETDAPAERETPAEPPPAEQPTSEAH